MIDLREIDETIDELKRHGNTIQAAERLAMLYIARDYMVRENNMQSAQDYSEAAAPPPVIAKANHTSDFLAACDGAQIGLILDVLDEHMDAIRVLYPREYDSVIERIKEG